jgi:hypothetical protein
MVADSTGAQPVYEDIFLFYKSLGMHHPLKPPLETVDDYSLDQYMYQEEREKGGPEQHVRGLCLSKSYTHLKTARIEENIDGTLTLRTGHKQMRHIHRTEVTGIVVLSGMDAMTTGSVLAHELMHAWLRMHNFRNLSKQLEEGMCQLMSHLWTSAQNVKVHHPKGISRTGKVATARISHDWCSQFSFHCPLSGLHSDFSVHWVLCLSLVQQLCISSFCNLACTRFRFLARQLCNLWLR